MFYDYAGVLYDVVLLFWRIVINIFFREIRPRGSYNIPKDGAVILVIAPHHNQFLDPLLVSTEVRKEVGRRLSFLIAAKSMKVPVVGQAARIFQSIPVARAADHAKTGKGLITLSNENPLIVRGINGTEFTKACMPKGQLVLPKEAGYATGEIAEIISDDEIRLSREFVTLGKGGASDVKATQMVQRLAADGLAYKVLPHIDQHDVYAHVYKKLNEGGVLGIFPEGGSHDRPDLLPLKAGVSVMALGAMTANKNLKIKVVPVGLSYFHAHKFRSRAVVEFGTPIEVPRDFADMYEQGGKQKRDACGKLLELIHDGIKAVTIRAPDFETLMVVQAGRRLYKRPGQHLTLSQVVELNKRFIEAYEKYRDEPRIVALRQRITRYNRQLRNLGLRDHQVERATTQRRFRNLALLIYRSALLLAWAILALPGVITHAPIFVPAKLFSMKKAKEALAGSTVKIAGNDVLATWKVLFSVAATPLLYIFYAISATYLAIRFDASTKLIWSTPLLVFVVMPFLAMSSLKFGEAGMDVFKSLRPLFLSLLPGSQKELDNLRRTREDMSNELSELIDEYGPQLWENYHKSRFVSGTLATVPGSEPQNDSNVLNHPLQWIDSRIFGWSRSSALGANAWNAPPQQAGIETSSQPESDEEMDEDVDYDDVLAIIDVSRKVTGGRGRRKSSPKGNGRGAYEARQDAQASALEANAAEGLQRRKARAEARGDTDEAAEVNTIHA